MGSDAGRQTGWGDFRAYLEKEIEQGVRMDLINDEASGSSRKHLFARTRALITGSEISTEVDRDTERVEETEKGIAINGQELEGRQNAFNMQQDDSSLGYEQP